MNRVIYILIIIVFFASCRKKEVGPQFIGSIDEYQGGEEQRVLIFNEGNFNVGNASISSINILSQEVSNNIYQYVNQSALGDVVQSASYFNSKCYVVINNSQKIIVLDSSSLNHEGEIVGFTSPRYFLPITQNKAYVTNLYVTNGINNVMYVIDLISNTIVNTIQTGGFTDELILHQNYVYVTKRNSNQILKINTSSDTVERLITIGYDPLGLVIDKNNKLWALCSGGYLNQHIPQLYRINLQNDSVEKVFDFSSASMSPDRLRIDNSKENLYFLNKDVFKMNIYDETIPLNFVIPSEGRNFYGLGVCPFNNELFVSDAKDYQQRGKVYHYAVNHDLIRAYEVGIIPQFILF